MNTEFSAFLQESHSHVNDSNVMLDSFKRASASASGYIYSLPQGIEVFCGIGEEHGILEIRSTTTHYQVCRGDQKISLWVSPTVLNPQESSKKFRKQKKRLEKLISRLFKATENGLFSIEFNQCEVKTNMTNQCQVSSYIPNFCKPIVFQPFAFFKDGARLGGAYFTMSSTRSLEDEKTIHVQKIITGFCLRPNFLMITEKGQHADLVDMVYLNVPQYEQKKIVDFCEIDGIHPYETANVEMLKNLLPFFTSISQTGSPILFFHFPLEEYLIHGISIFLAGNMTLKALDVYANLLVNYASVLKQRLLSVLEDIRIQFSSPLQILIQNTVSPEVSFTRQFFQNINVPLEQDKPDRSMASKVAAVALKCLKEQPGISGVAWTKISEQGQQNERDLSLKCLTEWSYSVHVAIHSFESLDGEVAVVDDAWERRITIAFKKYFQDDSWPSILCFHWLMPLGMPSVSSLYHLPVSAQSEHCSTTEIERMIGISSNRISEHGLS